ncbi:hypothetical protein CQ12_06530 [Bradyrhizobium jicamae]|uniref:Uncharacterized protein n=1 Tax=Bradyrhizobium jicamae TaxID=280332 RepID=A0A0R3L522_9BRAD|nr:hypothetical protein CQ12_06530 [Bradyrhizobium jicamae]
MRAAEPQAGQSARAHHSAAPVQQGALRQRSSQSFDTTDVRSNRDTVLCPAARAAPIVFGRRDDRTAFLSRPDILNDDRAKHEQCDQNQPARGRS